MTGAEQIVLRTRDRGHSLGDCVWALVVGGLLLPVLTEVPVWLRLLGLATLLGACVAWVLWWGAEETLTHRPGLLEVHRTRGPSLSMAVPDQVSAIRYAWNRGSSLVLVSGPAGRFQVLVTGDAEPLPAGSGSRRRTRRSQLDREPDLRKLLRG